MKTQSISICQQAVRTVFFLLTALVTWSATCFSASGSVILRGAVGPRVINDHVLIPAGASCTLNGTIIRGTLSMDSNAQLVANRARITGDLISHIGGRIQLGQATHVTGSLQVSRFRAVTIQGDVLVVGSVLLTSGTSPKGTLALLLKDSTVRGEVVVVRTTGEVRILNSTVNKNVTLAENLRGPNTIMNNTFRRDLFFGSNRGGGVISRNTVKNNLTVIKNSPRPAMARNDVTGTVTVD